MSIYQVSKFAENPEPLFSFRRFLENTANLGLVLPFGAASVTSVVSLAHTGEISLPLVSSAFLCVYSSYLIDHLADVGRLDGNLESTRTKTLSRKSLFTAFGLAAFVAAAGIALVFSGLEAFLLLLCFPLAVALYGTSLFGTLAGKLLPYRRLKDIPGIKAFYTAFFWGLLMLYASRFVDAQDLRQTVFFFVYMMLSDFVNTVFCDFKDLARDRVEGVKTLPLLLGVARTSKLIQAVNGIALMVLAVSVHLQWIPAWMLALAPVHLYVRAIVDHGQKLVAADGNPGDAAMDAEFLLWLPLVLGGLALGL